MKIPAITVIGSNMVDLVSYLERHPEPGETVFGRHFAQGFGGKGANQAVMASLLGADVRIVTCLGRDRFTQPWMDHFAAHGIDTACIAVVEDDHCGVASIWVSPSGENQIVLGAGANRRLAPEMARRALDGRPADVVLSQLEVPQATILEGFRRGRSLGAVTILNPGPAAHLEPALLEVTDWLLPNETELRLIASSLHLPGEPDDVALACAVSLRLDLNIVVTLGSRGAAWARPRSGAVEFAAPRVTALDTTGAGDAFAGSFAFAIGAGLSVPDAVRLSVATSADSVTRRGTAASFSNGEALRTIVGEVLPELRVEAREPR
jgi:ribokinase